MAMKNHTPLPCQPFLDLTPEGRLDRVIVVKMTLELVPGDAALRAQGFTHTLKLHRTQAPLVLTDSCHGALHTSSVRWESDLSPIKPQCDVIFIGNAHAPRGRPCRRFQVALRVTSSAHGRVLVDKALQVTGERWLRRHNPVSRALWWCVKVGSLGLVRRCPWSLTWPQPLATLPLRYEYAYGGAVEAMASDAWSRRIPARHCLPGVDRTQAREAFARTGSDSILARGWWDENLVGRGYAPAWYLRAARVGRIPAPQLEDPEHPFGARAAWRAMRGKATGATHPCLRNQGLAVLGRDWEPRRRWAGTADESWAASGAPYPPDHDRAFNNCAHPDLRCRLLKGNEVVELVNLIPASMPGAGRQPNGDQSLRFQLPGIVPFLHLVQATGERDVLAAGADTLVLEPEEGRVTLLFRLRFPSEPLAALVELRLAMPGEVVAVPVAFA